MFKETDAVYFFKCSLDSDTQTYLKIFLFKDVENTDFIRNKVVKGEWKCAVIKPSLILDPFQIAVAANKAAFANHTNTMVTKTVYTEILFNLSLSKNIFQSLSKFGVEKDVNMLVCFLVKNENDDSEEIIKQIQGKLCPIGELSSLNDLKEVKSVYRINESSSSCLNDLLDIIISKMVTKNFISN